MEHAASCDVRQTGRCTCSLGRPFRGDERKAVLTEAIGLTTGDRNATYDEPEDNFARIALHWRAFFKNRFAIEVQLEAVDVAVLMILMKMARLEFRITHRDSWVDGAGYAACGAAIVANMTRGNKGP